MSLGVIGFGRLGELMTRHLAKDCPVVVYDKAPRPARVVALGARPGALADACAQEIVVPAVPIKDLEAVLKRMAPLLRPGTLVVDVCSVKEHPVRAMKRLLPRGVEILATHPNFGPDSAADSLRDRQIAVWPVRIRLARYKAVAKFLRSKGLSVEEISPRDHDRNMAGSLLLTHFIGRGLIAFGAKPSGMDTEGYKRLLRILATVQNDTWQLFADMNRYNAFAPAMRRRFMAAMASVERKVGR